MVNYESICEDCPLRTKVDLGRLSITPSNNGLGLLDYLTDGNNRYRVMLFERETGFEFLTDERIISLRHIFQEKINNCFGPERAFLKNICGANVASSWIWEKTDWQYKPNFDTADDIVNWLELLADESKRGIAKALVGLEEWGKAKTTHKIVGANGSLSKNTTIFLDRKLREDTTFTIVIPNTPIEYSFTVDEELYWTNNPARIIAVGLALFLNEENKELVTFQDTSLQERIDYNLKMQQWSDAVYEARQRKKS